MPTFTQSNPSVTPVVVQRPWVRALYYRGIGGVPFHSLVNIGIDGSCSASFVYTTPQMFGRG